MHLENRWNIWYSFLSAEPHFLHAIDYGNYVYFFLSEIAVEYTTLGKVCACVKIIFHYETSWLKLFKTIKQKQILKDEFIFR